ncbi:ferritin-like domain-containing protein [Granulicella cerasi]|uniref:Ferritin-like domain-containing protein n=1 Tax=Granulicella cerasi TaxID=741063 RepID=A0ABW1ZD79_9BACT|nr:ferritin-like domain-containing protein [Granulicella cerasi]
MTGTLQRLVEKARSRRSFLAGAGSVAAAAALAGCSDDGTIIAPKIASYSDADILTFALNLEYLEAEFYLRAATGAGLASTDTGSSAGAVTVPTTTKLSGLTNFQQNLLNELAYTEQQHVKALRAALTAAGATPVSRPAIDFVTPFNTLASLAGIGSSLNAFTNFDTFITAAALFEDVGVTAYAGAATAISAAGVKSGILAAAAGIMATEAYHGATLRGYLTSQAYTLGTTAYPYYTYFNQLQTVISTLSTNYGTVALAGPTAAPQTTVPSTVIASTIVPADANGLALPRSTDQVLHIVYGTLSNTSGSTTSAAGVTKGGFFPAGLNGNISTTQS